MIIEHLQRPVRNEHGKRHSLYQPPKSGPFPGAAVTAVTTTTTTKPCKNVSGRGRGKIGKRVRRHLRIVFEEASRCRREE